MHIFIEGRCERIMKPVDDRCLMFNCGHLGKGNRGSQVFFMFCLTTITTGFLYQDDLQPEPLQDRQELCPARASWDADIHEGNSG